MDEKQQLEHKTWQIFCCCSGSKQLSVGAVVSKSNYIAIGISPFDLKLSSEMTKFLLLKLWIIPGTPEQFSICLFCLSACKKVSTIITLEGKSMPYFFAISARISIWFQYILRRVTLNFFLWCFYWFINYIDWFKFFSQFFAEFDWNDMEAIIFFVYTVRSLSNNILFLGAFFNARWQNLFFNSNTLKKYPCLASNILTSWNWLLNFW